MRNPFKKKAKAAAAPLDPIERLRLAVDEFNAALGDVPAGTRIGPWVERRAGMRPLLILQEWSPQSNQRVYPPSEADQLRNAR